VNEQLLSEFGDYLLSHRGEITAEWAVAIQRGPASSSPGFLGDTELVDHLPELFHNLAASLKSPQSDEQRREVVQYCAEATAGIAGAKATSSIKSFLRPASSGESLEESG
jgi:RsbRD-like negative regulator of sigma factor